MEYSNLLNPIPTSELDRRWSAVRREMDARGIDALVMQNSNDYLGGYVKWFTDFPAMNASPMTVIFPRDDRMIVVRQGPTGAEELFQPDDPVHRGIEKWVFCSSFCTVHYTRSYDAETVLKQIKGRGFKKVGLVAPAAMYYEFGRALMSGLEGAVQTMDATEFVDGIKSVKSDAEIALIRRTAAMQDEVLRRVVKAVKPGMRDFEVIALAQYEGLMLESEQGAFNGHSAPPGSPSSLMMHRHEQGRTIREGDHFNLLIENNGPGGLYTEVSRTLSFGKPSNELVDAFQLCVEAQAVTAKQLKPGVPCAEIYHAHNDLLVSRGRPAEKRVYAHGQGYDYLERPLIREDETMSLQPGMNLAVHPTVSVRGLFMMVCDNFLIDTQGAVERLHTTPHTVIEV